jgi:long-chain acyl-CoA synthetase
MGNKQSLPRIQYSYIVPGSDKPGSTPVYRSVNYDPDRQLPSGAKTLHESFLISAEKYGDCMFIGTRQIVGNELGDYAWKTYSEVRDLSKKIGFGLRYLGLAEKDENGESFIGIYSKTREEWIITDLALISQSIVSVTLYDQLSAEIIDTIANDTNMKAIVCSGNLSQNVIKIKKSGLIQTVKFIIQFESVEELDRIEANQAGIQVFSLKEVSELVNHGEEHPPSPGSCFTLCYTSGTTGKPKGTMLSHYSMVSTIVYYIEVLNLTPKDRHLSFLPLAHIMERTNLHFDIASGLQIGFYGGNILNLKDDLAVLKPTIFISAPRVFYKLYDSIKLMFNSAKGSKKFLIDKGLKIKKDIYNRTGSVVNKFWDRLVFDEIKNLLGGNVKIITTGSAPLAAEVLSFLKIVFSCPVVEGYGQTETCAGIFFTDKFETQAGIIGGPSACIEFKLCDIPDMNYFSTDTDEFGVLAPRGEMCFRGPSVFSGYYKAPELTSEAIDEEGWLHTGDVGTVVPGSGALKIIDRKKNFFKLSQGEYISPEKIERIYGRSFFISQIFVYGNGLQSYLLAVVVPDENYIIKNWIHKYNINPNTQFAEICKNPQLKVDILREMEILGREGGLLGYEIVKNIYIESELWTSDNLLTPSQKFMRFEARKKYKEIFDELYSQPISS